MRNNVLGLKFVVADPGFWKEKIRIRLRKKFGSGILDKHPESATLLPSSTISASYVKI
jgi:hypothetical protein